MLRQERKNIHLVLHENYDEHNKVIKDEKWKLNESSFPHALYEYIFLPCRKCVDVVLITQKCGHFVHIMR